MAEDFAGQPSLPDINSGIVVTSTTGTVIATVFIVFFLLMCFFFSLCDEAATLPNPGSIKHLSENKSKKSGQAVKIKNNTAKYSMAAQIGFTLNAVLAVILSEITYAVPLKQLLYSIAISGELADVLAVVIVSIITVLFVVTFGLLMPKKLALSNPDKIIIKTASPFIFTCALISPFAAVCSGIANIILRISGKNPNKASDTPTEEKILMMVDEGEESGAIEGNTKNMIENVFDFDDTTVGEIMTHRKDVVAVEDNQKITSLVDIAIKSGKSRIPVYHEDIDNIVGIIYVKDLLKYVSTNAPTQTIGSDIIHKAVFVPESKCCSEMFEYMTSHKTQIAIVVDEFGGTGGIITMEDLIESIVGNIQDEYDNEDDDIKKLNEYSFTVDGATSIDEISDLTGIDFDDETSDTIAGVMLDRMGHIPKSGEHPSIMIDGTRFTVQKVENRRISEILIVKHHSKNPEKSE
ncbi:MAG: hemolysin family protein [Clostridia bacterium]|nr:hemolysin family protein [Clostridia bacterium]